MRSVLQIATPWSLVAALMMAPVAPALAADTAIAVTPSAAAPATVTAAPPPQSAAASTTPSAGSASPTAAATTSTATALPSALTVTGTAAAPVAASATASAADDADQAPLPLPVIKDNAAAAGESQTASVQPQEASPFKWSNFWLGFLGGALVGGTYGILFDTTGKAETRNVETGLYGGIGALGFGTIAMLLGGTTPQAAGPPQTLLRHPAAGVQVAFRF